MTAAPLIRRFRDKDGTVTTYLPNGDLCALVGIGNSTLSNWAAQGLVRCTGKLNGSRNYAVVDAARLKLMSKVEAEALGVHKTPADKLAYQRAWYAVAQAETVKRAAFTGEVWDDYDIQFLVSGIEAGRSIEILAKALGRTYAATADRVFALRCAGDLPRDPKDEEWLRRTQLLLTAEEVESLV